MHDILDMFKLISDERRARILMLINKKELSVCQLMGITGSSQPLVSKNLSLLYRGGFLEERREGKLRFYSIRKDITKERKSVIDLLQKLVQTNAKYKEDLSTLKECSEFQKKVGRCDMKTLQEFMKRKKKKA